MSSTESVLASDDVIVRYLAVFHRFFHATAQYARENDRPGILLGGWLADALHNVPTMLCRSDARTEKDMDAWMIHFPERLRAMEAPNRIIVAALQILAPEGAAQELGLHDDLSNLDLAPIEAFHFHLNEIMNGCLWMRFIRNYGAKPRRVAVEDSLQTEGRISKGIFSPWFELENIWTEEAQQQADENKQTAELLSPIPRKLVRWTEFG